MRPFEGIRILDFSRVVSGPYCTHLLHLLGAEVIKVEDHKGDTTRFTSGDETLRKEGLGSTYMTFNTGKRSLKLDLKTPEAIEIARKLAQTADVVVENFRPGVMDRLGLGYAELKKHNPRIIYCAITGYGQTGPHSGSPAFDGSIQAASGMMEITGEPDGPPMRVGYTIGDTGAGINAALAISAALFQRNKTNESQFIDVAMIGCALSFMSQSAGPWLNGGIEPVRRGNLSVTREPTSDVFSTADGALMLAIIWDQQVEALLRAIGLEGLIGDPRLLNRAARQANAEFVRGAVQAALLKDTAQEWERRLNEAGAPCSRVLKVSEAVSQPQVGHRGQIMEFFDEKTAKPMRMLNLGFTYAHGSPGTERAPVRLGAESGKILAEIGYSETEIANLSQRGII